MVAICSRNVRWDNAINYSLHKLHPLYNIVLRIVGIRFGVAGDEQCILDESPRGVVGLYLAGRVTAITILDDAHHLRLIVKDHRNVGDEHQQSRVNRDPEHSFDSRCFEPSNGSSGG